MRRWPESGQRDCRNRAALPHDPVRRASDPGSAGREGPADLSGGDRPAVSDHRHPWRPAGNVRGDRRASTRPCSAKAGTGPGAGSGSRPVSLRSAPVGACGPDENPAHRTGGRSPGAGAGGELWHAPGEGCCPDGAVQELGVSPSGSGSGTPRVGTAAGGSRSGPCVERHEGPGTGGARQRRTRTDPCARHRRGQALHPRRGAALRLLPVSQSAGSRVPFGRSAQVPEGGAGVPEEP